MGRQGRRMTVLVLLGAPGAGKGTQAPILAERLGCPHVATGDLLPGGGRATARRSGSRRDRYMERGQLVPDDITIRMLLDAARPRRRGRRRHPRRLPAQPRPGRGARRAPSPSAARRVDRAALHRRPDARTSSSGCPDRWICQAAGHVYNESTRTRRASAGRLRPRRLAARPARRRPRADTIRARLAQQLGAAARGRRRTTGRPASCARSTAGRAIDDVTDALLAAVDDLVEVA